MGNRITSVGLDVHKEGIAVAVAEDGIGGEVREYGRIANTAAALDRLVRKLGHDGVKLRFCYEAGPCGYGIQRHLAARGHDCVVVALSLIPRRPGDRVKTDRRDAVSLARLHRAGELTPVWVPDPAHEAMRDLVRARLDAVHALPHGTSPWAEGPRQCPGPPRHDPIGLALFDLPKEQRLGPLVLAAHRRHPRYHPQNYDRGVGPQVARQLVAAGHHRRGSRGGRAAAGAVIHHSAADW
jgi:hypothetical protein